VEMFFVMVSSAAIGSRVPSKWIHKIAVIYPIILYFCLQNIVNLNIWDSFVLSGVSILILYCTFLGAAVGSKWFVLCEKQDTKKGLG